MDELEAPATIYTAIYEASGAKGYAAYAGPILPGNSEGDEGSFIIDCLAHHLNADNRVHGGVLMSLAADTLKRSLATKYPGAYLRPVSLNCDFLSAGPAGARLEGRGRITRTTRSMIFAACEIHAAEQLLMTASGIYEIDRGAI